jgi:hypothetical protein
LPISAKRMAALREHVRAESAHDMDALIGGMTPDCFNDVTGAPEPFTAPRLEPMPLPPLEHNRDHLRPQ